MAAARTAPSLLLGLLLAAAPIAPESDPRAGAVGRQMWSALGGDGGWNTARYFRFDFVVSREGTKLSSRAHFWDRFTGRYRVEGTDKSGAPYGVYFNVNSREGAAYLNGKKVEDPAEARKWLDQGYAVFINDTYWLLAPLKLFDPGVNLTYVGEDKGPEGQACDVVKLSFDSNVGLTPKDVYWMYVDRRTHLMVQWKYVLKGADEPPTSWVWSDWKEFGKIRLSTTKTSVDRPISIRFDNLSVAERADDAALTPPAP